MKLEIPTNTTLVHEMRVPVRWGDMDALGHVNNTLYFRYMETARIDWLTSLGLLRPPMDEGMVIANAFCNFIQQLHYPAELLVRTFISTPGRSALDSWVTMERTDQPDTVVANGGATLVWLNFKTGKSAPLPDALRKQLVA